MLVGTDEHQFRSERSKSATASIPALGLSVNQQFDVARADQWLFQNETAPRHLIAGAPHETCSFR
jgi:hypothetical protein